MYNWIEQTLGVGDGLARILAFTVSLIVVLVLFALFVIILKRLMGTNFTGPRNRQPRIQIMDAATIDPKRRLVLVRRDNVEHLLLIGGTTDVVVEQSIIRNAPLGAQHPRQVPTLAAGPGPLPEPPSDLDFDDEQEPIPGKVETRSAESTTRASEPAPMPVVETASVQPFTAPTRQVAEPPKRIGPSPEASLVRAAAGGLFASRQVKTDEKQQEPPTSGIAEVAPRPTTDAAPAEAAAKAPTLPPVTPPQPVSARPALSPQTASLSGLTASRNAPENRSSPETASTARPAPAIASPAITPPNAVDDSELFEPQHSGPEKTAPLTTTLANFAARKPALAPSQFGRTPPKITPPASGPAARAKTAVLAGSGNPSEVKEDAVSEDEAVDTTALTSAEPAAAKSEPLPFPWRGSAAAPQVTKPVEPPAPAKTETGETVSATSMDTKPSETGLPDDQASTSALQTSDNPSGETKAEAKKDDLDLPLGTEKKEAAAGEKASDSNAPTVPSEQENDNIPAESAAVVQAPTSPFKPVVVQSAPKVEHSRVHATPTEVNPIEAEMEKLLDEIHGPRSI